MKVRANQLAKEELTGILDRTGHTLCPDDVQDLIDLCAICNRVERPEEPEAYDLLKLPVRVGESGITIRPITLARAKWIGDHSGKHGDDVSEYAAIVFALSVEDSRELFAHPLERHAKKIAEICKLLDVAPDELDRCLRRVMNFAEVSDAEAELAGYGPIIVAICREYGGTPDYWLHDATMETIESMIDGLWRKQEAEHQAAMSAAGKHVTGAIKMRALVDLRNKKRELLEKWGVTNG